MWYILGFLAIFFGFRHGGCGFLLMLLAFLFVLSMLRRASYGPRYPGYGPRRYPPGSYTPGHTYPPQNNPPSEGTSASNPYYANPYYANPNDAGAKTVRTAPNDDIVERSEGSGADTIRIDPPPGAGGEPTRLLQRE